MLTHISNNYLGSTVHSSLADALVKRGYKEQFVYCPLQRKFEPNSSIGAVKGVTLSSPRIFNNIIRYFPLIKVFVAFVFFLIEIRKNKVKPSFIIAHNLWSDGMVAWLYHKLTGTPFMVAVRNTDVNRFIPSLPQYRWMIRKVASESQCVVFINRAYANRIQKYFRRLYNVITNQVVIFNGIHDDWLKLIDNWDQSTRELQVCYLGRFLAGKNIKNSILAIQHLRAQGTKIRYVAIGGTSEQFLQAADINEVPGWVEVLPRTQSRAEIAKHLQKSRVFLMPSFKETFGLVYVEALSQGCAVVHSQGEGIDGVFDEGFVRAVDPNSIEDIANKTKELLDSYPNGVSKSDVQRLVAEFSWANIAKQYSTIISSAIK